MADGTQCDWVLVEPGYPAVVFTTADGKTISVLPTTGTPWPELLEHESDDTCPQEPLLVVLGAGLGHHLRDRLNRYPDLEIRVWEPNLDRFVVSLGLGNWEGLAESSRIRWSIGSDMSTFGKELLENDRVLLKKLPLWYRPWVLPSLYYWEHPAENLFINWWLDCFQHLHSEKS
jgi:hypothetical protein